MNLDAQSLTRLLVAHPVPSHAAGSGMDFAAFASSVLPCLPGATVVVSTRHQKGDFPRAWLWSSMVGISWEGRMWVDGEGVSTEAFRERMVLQTCPPDRRMAVIARVFSAPDFQDEVARHLEEMRMPGGDFDLPWQVWRAGFREAVNALGTATHLDTVLPEAPVRDSAKLHRM